MIGDTVFSGNIHGDIFQHTIIDIDIKNREITVIDHSQKNIVEKISWFLTKDEQDALDTMIGDSTEYDEYDIDYTWSEKYIKTLKELGVDHKKIKYVPEEIQRKALTVLKKWSKKKKWQQIINKLLLKLILKKDMI